MSDTQFSQRLREIGRGIVRDSAGPDTEYDNIDLSGDPAFSSRTNEYLGGEGVGRNEQRELDQLRLSPAAFAKKYGREAQEDRITARPDEDLDPVRLGQDRRYVRKTPNAIGDLAAQFGGGAIRGTAGLVGTIAQARSVQQNLTLKAALGLPLDAPMPLNQHDVARQAIAEFGDDAANFVTSFESDIIKEQDAISRRTTEARFQDSQEEFDRSEKNLSDTLRKIGRDAMIAGERYAENPSAFSKTTANAVGSLVPSAIGAGGLTTVASGIVRNVGLQGTKAGAFITATGGAAGIGIVEGAGAYNETVNEVRGMSEEQLTQGSKDYVELRENGASHEEAQAIIAEAAGRKAQLVQTGVATVAGYIFPKFEANPLSKGYGATVTKNTNVILGEGFEETVQSASGTASQNAAIREFADSERQITQGVGEAATEGLVGGFGATSTVTAPAVIRGTIDEGLVEMRKVADHAIKVRADQERRRLDDLSPVGEKATTENISQLESLIQTVERFTRLQSQVDEELDPETKASVEAAAAEAAGAPTWLSDTTSEDFTSRTEKFADDVVEGSRIQTLRKVAAKLNDSKYTDPETANAAADFYLGEIERLQQFAEEAQLAENATNTEKAAADLATAVINNKVFSTGFDTATEVLNNSESSARATPREVALNPVGVSAAPERVSEESFASEPVEIQKAAAVSRAIAGPEAGEAGSISVANRDSKGRQNDRKGTRKELLFTSKRASYGVVPSFNDLVSMALRGAIRATRQNGNTLVTDPKGGQVDARDEVARLRNLVQHQINKFEAARKSWEYSRNNPGKDASQTFASLDPKDGETFTENGGKIFVNATSPNSIETFRQIREDANTGIRAYNALLEQFPEVYQGDPIPELELPAEVPNARPEPQTSQDQQTETGTTPENGQSDSVDSGAGSDTDSVRPTGELTFDELFDGKTEGTLASVLEKVGQLPSLDPTLRAVLTVVANSALAQANPDLRVRQGRPDEPKPRPTTKGWYDPVAGEIVLFVPDASEVLHEALHAVTLEVLNQNLFTAYNNIDRPLTEVEKAAKRLLEMSNEFIDSRPENAKMAEIQAMMRSLIRDEADPKRGLVLATNEFMAYGLTEQGVTQILANREYRDPSLAKRILNALRRLLGLKNDSVLDKVFFDTHTLTTDYQAAIQTAQQAEKAQSNDVTETPAVETTPTQESIETQAQTDNQAGPETGPDSVPLQDAVEPSATELAAPAGVPSETVTEAPAETVQEPAPVEQDTPVQTEPPASAVAEPEAAVSPEAASTQVAEPEAVSSEQEFLPIGRNLTSNVDGENNVTTAYDLQPVLRYETPLGEVLEAARTAEDRKYDVSEAQEGILKSLTAESQELMEAMNKRLQDKLGQRYVKSKPETNLDILQAAQEGKPTVDRNGDPVDITHTPGGLIFSFLDKESVEDGNPVYDQHLLQLAMLAAMDYVMNEQAGGGLYKIDDVLDALGLDSGTEITGEMYDVVNFGRSGTDVKEGLARHIKAFWGARENNSISPNLTDGLAEAMADEIMDVLQEIGDVEGDFWFAKQSIKFEANGEDRTYVSFKLGNSQGQGLDAASTFFRDALTSKDDDMHKYQIGEPIRSVSETIAKDKNIQIPERKRAAIQKQQDTPFYMSTPFLNLLNQIGVPALEKILGHVDVSDQAGFMNDLHRKAVEGKNLSIATSIKQVQKQIKAIRAYAEKAGVPEDQVPIHYKLEISLNGRFFMQGFNPQANKLAREIFTPTRSTIDITSEGDLMMVYAAIGQAMDDFKIENLGLAQSAETALAYLEKPVFAAAVDALRNLDREGSVDAIVGAMADRDVEASARLLKALMVAAQIEDAKASGQTTIDIDLAMELDGKTNGPITAAIQMNTESFSPEFLALVRRGGFFLGSDFSDYADYKKNEDNSADLYEVTGDVMTGELTKWNLALKKGTKTQGGRQKPAVIKQVNEAQRLVLELLSELGDIEFSPGDNTTPGVLKIKRKGTKSPITQNLYGAGGRSIAGGLTNALFKMVYEEITDAVRNKDGERVKMLAEKIDALAQINMGKDKEGMIWAGVKPVKSQAKSLSAAIAGRKLSALQEFKFASDVFNRVENAINLTYIPGFEAALGETVGHSVKNNNDFLVEATNLHADIYLTMVRAAIHAETERQRADGTIKKGWEISKADYYRILAEYRKYAPVIDAGASVFDLTGSDSETTTEVAKRRAQQEKDGLPVEPTFNTRSRTLSGSSSGSKRASLAGAGVKILPYNVIANADVEMVTGVYSDERILTDTLAVHDGIEVPIHRLREMSEIMNEKVADSWQMNTFEPVLQSIQSLLSIQGLGHEHGLQEKVDELRLLEQIIQDRVDQRQARIEAIKTIQFTVDGVPGAESPFRNEEGRTFNSEKDLVDHLEYTRKLELERIKNERAERLGKTVEQRIEIEQEGGSDLRKALDGTTDIQDQVRILGEHLTSKEQRMVFDQLVRSPAFQDAIEAGLSLDILPQDAPTDAAGVYMSFFNTIQTKNVTPETLLHELVHAVTLGQVEAHYLDPTSNAPRAAAIRRLESLMEDFLGRNYPASSVEHRLKQVINAAIEQENMPLAVNEFMAWSLSNQNLIEKGKETVVTDPLSQARALGKRVIQIMRRILGFSSNRVFDHILFNTVVVANNGAQSSVVSDTIARHQITEGVRTNDPDSDRKVKLQHLIGKQVTAFLTARNRGDIPEQTAATQARHAAEYAEAELRSFDALSRVQAAGFDVDTAQDQLLFKTLQSIFDADFKIDKLAALEVQKVFEKIANTITAEDVWKAMGVEPASANQTQQEMATRMVRVIQGLPFTNLDGETLSSPERNRYGQTNNLGVFIALAQTSQIMRNILAEKDFKDLDLQTDIDTRSLDGILSSVTNKVIGRLNQRVAQTREANQGNVQAALDTLTEQLLSYEADAASKIENDTSSFFAGLNAKGRGLIEGVGRSAGDSLRAAAAESNNDLLNAVRGIGTGLADLLVADRARSRVDDLTGLLNNDAVPEAMRNLWAEIRGITNDTRAVLLKVKAAKQQISAARQEYIETVPKILQNQFSKDFNTKRPGESNKQFRDRQAQAWRDMFNAFGKTDITTVIEHLGERTALGVFGSSDGIKVTRQDLIQEQSKQLAVELEKIGIQPRLAKKLAGAMSAKAKQLGDFQVNHNVGTNLLTSAHAILGLYNEDGLSVTDADLAALHKAIADTRGSTEFGLNNVIRTINTIASLEAVDALPQDIQSRISDIVRSERQGIDYMLTYMKDLRKMESEKTGSQQARINGFKGKVPSTARRKYSVIIAKDSDAARLAEIGYTRVRSYDSVQSRFNPLKRNHSYYFSAHTKLATYNQGAMQTVQDTYFGVDPKTGLTVGPETTGNLITGSEAKQLTRRIKQNPNVVAQDGLIPRFNGQGVLIGYEQYLAPDMIQQLEQSQNLAESLGKWAGRIHEERSAEGFNNALIDALAEQYDPERADEYAQFGRVQNEEGQWVLTEDLENDPIWRESYFLIPKATRVYAEEVFGGPIPIRKDLINNALGFRSASVSDIWFDHRTRRSAELNQTLRDVMLATPFLGKDMYKYLQVAEEGLQQVVSEVKHVIVVKSGVILVANTLSNIVQLAGREVPLSYMGKRTRVKYQEVAQFQANEQLKIRLRADMLATDSVSKKEQIQRRIDSIEESEKRMSIWPLIKANQFTTISEGLTDSDKALMDGKFMDWVEQKAAELPGGLSTVARYAIVSKDTALYQGMARAVQYSDFVAKSIYYDFLTTERGIDPAEALQKIDQEFINYDLNDSRTRTYLESIGMTWFMNFKLRALKIAIDMAKNNPASVVLSLGLAGLIGMNVGSPATDNIAGAAADGRLGYSIGPGMVEAGWNLNPWVNVTS